MIAAQLGTVSRIVSDTSDCQIPDGPSDGSLIGSFVDRKDQAAFELLLQRHGPMVMRVCLRALGNPHDAEDALQATFLVLARQAGSIRKRQSVASWLHGVAHRMATHAKRGAGRRHQHESQTRPNPPVDPALSVAWRELQQLLEAEIAALPETLRGPFIDCCLENLSCAEAARLHHLQEATVRKRLSRARRVLQERLTKRGISLTAALAASAIGAGNALASVPPSIVVSTAKAATLMAGGGAAPAGLVSSKVIALTEGVLKAMLVTKMKVTAVLVGAVILGGAGGGVTLYHALAAQSGSPAAPAESANADNKTVQSRPADETAAIRDQALNAARRVEDPVAKVRCLAWVAKAQHVCGNERASRDILKEASVFVDSVPQDDAAGASGRLQSLHTLSVYQAEVGDFDTAMKTAAKIQKPDLLGFGAQAVQSQRAWATAGIAIRQAKAGRFADALKTARSIDEIDYGDASRTDWKNYAYIGIADAQARAKESGQAAQTASLIKADQDRAEALATIAMRQAEAGNRAGAEMTLKTALKIAEALPANVGTLYSRKVPILSAVARVQADMGDLKGALETCEQMPINSKTQKSVAAERELVLLRDNLRSGDRAGALEMAKQFPAGREYPDRNHALGLVVDAQLKAKDLGGAVATLAEMQSAVKLRAAVDIALAMSRSGDKPGALRLLQQTAKELEDVSYDPNDDTGRPMLAYKLAGGWTAVGEPKAAGEWIAREPSPYVQVFALLGMIDAVARRDGRQELVFEW